MGLGTSAAANDPQDETKGRPVTADRLLEASKKPFASVPRLVGPFLNSSHTLIVETPGPSSTAIQKFDADSRTLTKLADGEGAKVSPGGEMVAFARPSFGDDNHTEIAILEIASSKLTTVAKLDRTAFPIEFAWSPTADKLAYKITSQVAGIKSTENPSSAVVSGRTPGRPQSAGRSTEIRVYSLASRQEYLLFHTNAIQVSGLLWNDSLGIITDLAEQDLSSRTYQLKVTLVSIRASDGFVRALIQGHAKQADHRPTISPDATHIVFQDVDPRFTSYYPTSYRLAILDLKSGRFTKVEEGSSAFFPNVQWSFDSNTFKFIANGQQGLSRTSVNATTGRITSREAVPFLANALDWPLESADRAINAVLVEEAPSERVLLNVMTAGNRAGSSATVLSDPLTGFATGRVEDLKWRDHDSLTIHGFLIYPLGYDPAKKYPLIVSLHGGPAVRWPTDVGVTRGPLLFASPLEWHYWAGRGFFVLQADYRESQNYGDKQILLARDHGDLFERDFDDINEGVSAVLAKGVVDANRIAIVGHSWGSFEVNWIISHTRRYRAAISYEGGDMFLDWGSYGFPLTAYEWYLGDKSPLENLRAYKKESAVFNISGASTPTLFVNCELGVNSPAQAWLTAALLRQNVDAEYVLYKGEGHVVRRPENQADLLDRSTRWIESHMSAGLTK